MTAQHECSVAHSERKQALKRAAIQVVAFLPEDQANALRVLCYARQLVLGFLGPEHEPGTEGNVLKLKAGD